MASATMSRDGLQFQRERAVRCLEAARRAEKRNKLESAVVGYEKGLELLFMVMKNTTDPRRKESLRQEIDGILTHAEEVKSRLKAKGGSSVAARPTARRKSVPKRASPAIDDKLRQLSLIHI